MHYYNCTQGRPSLRKSAGSTLHFRLYAMLDWFMAEGTVFNSVNLEESQVLTVQMKLELLEFLATGHGEMPIEKNNQYCYLPVKRKIKPVFFKARKKKQACILTNNRPWM